MMLRFPAGTGAALAILAAVLVIVLAASEARRVFEVLEALETLVRDRWWTALAVYVLAFVVLASVALPIASLFCLCAGFLFGLAAGAAAALTGGLLAAILTFALVRKLGGERVRIMLDRSRASALMDMFERDTAYYLILLRIVPVGPFFMINAAAGLTAISSARYILATAIGLAPITLVYASVGAGLESMVKARELAGPELVLQPQLVLPLAVLAALVVLSWWWRRRLAQMRRGNK